MPSACEATLIQIILQVSVVASLAISAFAARRGRSFSAPVQWRQFVSLPSLLASSLSRPTSTPCGCPYWPHPPALCPPRFCLAGKQLPALQEQEARNSNQQNPFDPPQLGPDLSNRKISCGQARMCRFQPGLLLIDTLFQVVVFGFKLGQPSVERAAGLRCHLTNYPCSV